MRLIWRGFRFVELETDELLAIAKLKGASSDYEPHHRLIDAINELIHRDWTCKITHVYREPNKCADWMATHFDDLELGLHVFNNPTTGITSALTADAMGLVWKRAI